MNCLLEICKAMNSVWCLSETKIGCLQMTERFMVRAMCGVQLKDRKRVRDLLLM